MMDELNNIYHFYVPAPASEESTSKAVNGSVSITNYQLIFRAKDVKECCCCPWLHLHIIIFFLIENKLFQNTSWAHIQDRKSQHRGPLRLGDYM